MADTPQYLALKDSRDHPRPIELLVRRVLLVLLLGVACVALANVFGERPMLSTAAVAGTTFSVHAPSSVRGGLFYEGRFTVVAGRAMDHATIVLDDGWLEQMSINTIEPSPVSETSREGRLALDMGHLAAGDRLVLYLQLQTNPAQFGRRAQGADLYDGETLVASIDRTVTVFP